MGTYALVIVGGVAVDVAGIALLWSGISDLRSDWAPASSSSSCTFEEDWCPWDGPLFGPEFAGTMKVGFSVPMLIGGMALIGVGARNRFALRRGRDVSVTVTLGLSTAAMRMRF